MGKYFSNAVENAIEDIYCSYDRQRAKSAIRPLTEAAGRGDADAAYILARCYSGPEYSWTYNDFPEKRQDAEQYLNQSIGQGSEIGILGAMRMGRYTSEIREITPKGSLRKAWDKVRGKADAGSAFCQMMIGDTYYWLDVVRIQEKSESDFESPDEFRQYLRDTERQCIPWFDRAFRGGIGFAGKSLYNLYTNGDSGTFDPEPEKAEEMERLGAELGYPEWQERYATTLLKKGGHEPEALELCNLAARQGQLSAWFYIGRAYQFGKGAEKDVRRALDCYEKGLEDKQSVGCANRAGELYFYGAEGITQNYARAVELLEMAHQAHNTWGNDILGVCCLQGLGCRKNPERARELFEEVEYKTALKSYGLGLIYADGLGVAEDIRKGVEYLQEAGTYEPAREALQRFKRNIYGKWVRR